MSENTEENQNKESISSKEHHSESSHHRHHSEHSHRSHHSHSGSRRHYSEKDDRSDNIPAEYSKRKKMKLWRRSLFISMICILFVILLFMIVNAGKSDNLWNGFMGGADKSNIEEIKTELDSLKTENMNLKYELEKYKNKYGDLDAAEEDTKESKGSTSKKK